MPRPEDNRSHPEAPFRPVVVRKRWGGGPGVGLAALFIGAVCLLFSVFSQSFAERLLGGLFSAAFFVGGASLLIRARSAGLDTLTIDERGVEIVEGGRRRVFAWQEIARVRIYDEGDAEFPLRVVALERLGELLYVPAMGDVRGFPMDADDLVALIREGKRRFGCTGQA